MLKQDNNKWQNTKSRNDKANEMETIEAEESSVPEYYKRLVIHQYHC